MRGWRGVGMVGLAPKWVRLDPQWDKSGTFSGQISVQLARCPITGQSDPISDQILTSLPSPLSIIKLKYLLWILAMIQNPDSTIKDISFSERPEHYELEILRNR